MKKSLKYFAMVGLAALVIGTSCKKDDPKPDENPDPTPTESPNEQKTVEEQKTDIETSSVDVVSELRTMQETEGMKAVKSLAMLMGSEEESSSMPGLAVIKVAEALESDNTEDVLKAMNEEVSLKAEFDEIAGTYSWNPATDDFDQNLGGDAIIIEFPSEENGTTNDANITISGLTTANISVDGESIEAPTGITAVLSVGTTEALKYTYSATVADDFINSVTTSITVDTYVTTASVSYSDTKVSESFSFKNGTKTILKFETSVEGDLKTIKNTQDLENLEVQEYITTVTSTFQFTDVVVTGTIQVKDLFAEAEGVEDGEEGVVILNKHASLTIEYADGTEIATSKAILEKDGTDEEVNVILTFKDGSEATIDAYFEESMTNFEKEVEELFEELGE